MNMKYKFKNCIRKIKWSLQKIKRGYSDEDIWNMDLWFLDIML